MLVVVLVALISLGVGAILAYAFGLFRIEKVELQKQSSVLDSLNDEQGGENADEEQAGAAEESEPDEPAIDLDDGISLKEKMQMASKELEDDGTKIKDDSAGESQDKIESLDEMLDEERFPLTDPLSEFKVGRGYLLDCQKMLDEAKEQGSACACAYFDFDRFRFINNLKGLSIGDYVLTRMGQELSSVFPPESISTRISADHFAVLFPVSSREMFEACSEQMQEICEKLRADIGAKTGLRIHMGIAVAESDDATYDIQTLIHKANIARHCIKQGREELWALYEENMITTGLYEDSALEDYDGNQYDGEFAIFYANQQNISSHSMVGCEALVRWKCEEETGRVSSMPGKDMIPTNTSKVIYQICREMSRWRKASKRVLLTAISLPVLEFYKKDVSKLIERCLHEFQLEPQLFAVSIDASVVRLDWTIACHQLKSIRELGVLVGVDGIGPECGDLSFLRDLPLDFVKLQRTFALGIEKKEEVSEAARKMLEQCREMELRVIFEGVETQRQATELQEIGAAEVQGRYCGRPLGSDDFMHGLLSAQMQRKPSGTVILDDASMDKGEWTI